MPRKGHFLLATQHFWYDFLIPYVSKKLFTIKIIVCQKN
jgi:hypothetical protein